jgi:hypothetical protein
MMHHERKNPSPPLGMFQPSSSNMMLLAQGFHHPLVLQMLLPLQILGLTMAKAQLSMLPIQPLHAL